MADKRSLVSTVQFKGPAGNATTDKRIVASQINLTGTTDKRLVASQVTLVAPPPDKRLIVARAQVVGAASTMRAVYFGSASGWVPVDVYLGVPGVWVKVA